MASIPLDLQKRCEQRWAARVFRPHPTAPKMPGPDSQKQQTEPDKGDLQVVDVSLQKALDRGTLKVVFVDEKVLRSPRKSH